MRLALHIVSVPGDWLQRQEKQQEGQLRFPKCDKGRLGRILANLILGSRSSAGGGRAGGGSAGGTGAGGVGASSAGGGGRGS